MVVSDSSDAGSLATEHVANLVLVIDPDAERRDRFTATIERLLAPLDGLLTEQCASGDFRAMWAREPRAPVSQVADTRGAAMIWGEAIKAGSSTRIDADTLRALWIDPRSAAVFDGFHAAAVYDSRVGLLVGADLLGLFPLYYWSSGDVVLAGSSAELFRHHPMFRMQLSPAGLVGFLLTSHLVDGRTLLEGVTRLEAGALLVYAKGSQPTEVSRYRIPISNRYFEREFASHVDILDGVLERAVSRHAPREHRHTLLLSGGLDSRMLGGYLARQGTEVEALTLGGRRDLEMTAATRVARALSFGHHAGDSPYEQYPFYADLQTKWEHLANGFSTIRTWGHQALLRQLPPRVVSGYVSDCILGGAHVHDSSSGRAPRISFQTVFAYHNRHGLHPRVLASLLRRDVFDGLIQSTLERLQQLYESYSDLESQRAWCFELCHRQRFHVGASAWRLCFGAWPVLPVIDRGILEAVGGMPATTIAGRRAQKELVCRQFPALAALPLDRNSYDTRPLQARRRSVPLDQVRYQWARVVSRLPAAWRQERRYYYRVYDIDNQGWRAVRQQAEPHRSHVLHLFERDVLNALLPPADARVHYGDAIVDSSGLKLLLGFLLWSADHL